MKWNGFNLKNNINGWGACILILRNEIWERIRKVGSGSIQGGMKSFEPSTFDEKFIITYPISGKPLANQKDDIHLPDGKILSGVTDSSGNSPLIMSKAIDGLKIVLKK